MELISDAQLPTKFGDFIIEIYQNKTSGLEHYVLKINTNKEAVPLVRIHSECTTGDIFGSLRCDCQDQLHHALAAIYENGNGALIYLKNHEGRGIGIANKIKAYQLQEQGFNTYEANEKLGLPADARNYQDAISILQLLGFDTIQIITNNPLKQKALADAGIIFTTIHAPAKINEHNQNYIDQKIQLGHHQINIQL